MRRLAALLTLIALAATGPVESAAAATPKKRKAKVVCVKKKAKGKKAAATKRRTCRKARKDVRPKVPVRPSTPRPPAQAPPAQAPASPAAPAAPAAPPAEPVWSTLGATAYDIDQAFVLRLSKTEVPAGALTVFFRNTDSSLHNLWMSSPSGEATEVSGDIPRDANASRTLTVTPGAWTLFCSLPGHGSMTRSLTVR